MTTDNIRTAGSRQHAARTSTLPDTFLVFPEGRARSRPLRLRTPTPDGRIAIYIGESENVQRRFRNYRQGSEGQATSRS